jgi:hypothetical protein
MVVLRQREHSSEHFEISVGGEKRVGTLHEPARLGA